MDECRRCGGRLPDGAAFCPACGTPTGPSATASHGEDAAGRAARHRAPVPAWPFGPDDDGAPPPAATGADQARTEVLPPLDGPPAAAPPAGARPARPATTAAPAGPTSPAPTRVLPVQEVPLRRTPRAGGTTGGPGGPDREGREDDDGRRRVPVAVLALLALLVVGVASGLAALTGGGDDDRSPGAAGATTAAPTAMPSATPTGTPSETPTVREATSAPPTPTDTPSESPTDGPDGDPAAQAAALDRLLDAARPVREGAVRAVTDLQAQCGGRGDYGRAVSDLNQTIAARTQLLAELERSDTGDLPRGDHLKRTLRRAWESSREAERSFLAAGEGAGAGNCPAGHPRWGEGTAAAGRGREADEEFARTWNREVAEPFGLARRDPSQL